MFAQHEQVVKLKKGLFLIDSNASYVSFSFNALDDDAHFILCFSAKAIHNATIKDLSALNSIFRRWYATHARNQCGFYIGEIFLSIQ